MTEDLLSQTEAKKTQPRQALIAGGAALAVIAAVWLGRQPIAEAAGHGFCAQQQLDCIIHVSRLDFGGLTLRDFEVRNPDAPQAALRGERVSVDLAWGSLFSPRADWIGGEGVTVRLDLSGARPLLGDLDAVVNRFSSGDGEPGPLPRLNLSDVRIVGDTPLGPVEARGSVSLRDAENFTIDFDAPAAKLSLPGAQIDLVGGRLQASAQGDTIRGTLKLGLSRFETPGARLNDVNIDLSLDQSSGVLKAAGSAGAREIAVDDGRLTGAAARANVESAAVDLEGLTLARLFAGVQRLDLTATTGEGAIAGVAWSGGEASAKIQPVAGGGSAGKLTLAAMEIGATEGAARRLDIDVDVKLGAASGETGRALAATGVGRLSGASAALPVRTELARIAGDPLEALSPAYASAAREMMRRGSADFDVLLPFKLELAEAGGGSAAVLTGAELRAISGLSLVADGQGVERVAELTLPAEAGAPMSWTAAGALRLAGGGGPTATFALDRATGDGADLSAAGSLELRGWRVADNSLAGRATELAFETGQAGGKAAGAIDLQMTGAMAGGMWTRARIAGGVATTWSPDSFEAQALGGLRLAWDEVRFGDIAIGKSALSFAPTGKLASWSDGVLSGAGRLAAVEAPIAGANFTAEAKLNGASVAWSSAGTMKVSFDADPFELKLIETEQATPVRLADVSGVFSAREGWRLEGRFGGGSVEAKDVRVADLAGAFNLNGAYENLDGTLTAVTMRMSDPMPESQQRFEAVNFKGGAKLGRGIANFDGVFTLAKSGVQVASVNGVHNLGAGAGSLTFPPTPLIFRPRSFAPADLSPLLRGPANVTGRVDVSGGASWNADGVAADATIEMRRLGFALASAGVFEGVSGKIEVSDLLEMESAPGQVITLEKVTLGMPIEKGVIRFQLIGLEAIRLEAAEWPFADGFIRVQPLDFAFGAESNRIVARAENWDMTRIVELFKIPDVKVAGTISGDVPVVFSTGSARIDKAVLQASQEGGVIQYSGSTGDAAGSADANAKMLFDALKDFRYKVLKVGLDGDIAGRVVLSLNLQGSNPQVLNGAPFDLNISVDRALMELLGTLSKGDSVANQIIETISGGRSSGGQPD